VWRRIAVPAAPARVQRAEVGVHGREGVRAVGSRVEGVQVAYALRPRKPVVEPGMGRTRPQHQDQRAHPRAQVKQLIPVPVVAGQPGDLEAEDRAHMPEAHLGHPASPSISRGRRTDKCSRLSGPACPPGLQPSRSGTESRSYNCSSVQNFSSFVYTPAYSTRQRRVRAESTWCSFSEDSSADHQGQRPLRNMTDWYAYAPPKGKRRHWVKGSSAYELAAAWCPGNDLPAAPPELVKLLALHPDTRHLELVTGTPEHRLPFDTLPGEPPNADLALTARDSHGEAAVTVEAKADESYGRPVRQELAAAIRTIASDKNSNAVTRIQQLAASLLPPWDPGMPHLGQLRYQSAHSHGRDTRLRPRVVSGSCDPHHP
jgi:hypothetical protein